MKKRLLTCVVTLCSIFMYAQSTSNLIVFSEDGLKFYLILNGVRQNEVAATNIKVDKLNQPYYSAKIIFEDKKEEVLEKKYLQVVDVDSKAPLEVTYKIKRNNKNVNVLRFFSQVPIEKAMPISDEILQVHYNVVPMPEIFTTVVVNETTTTSGSNSNVSVNAGGVGVNVNINDPYYNQTTTTTSYTQTTISSSSVNNSNSQNTNYTTTNEGCNGIYPMSKANFAAAKQTITKQSFDDTKLTTAKQVIKSNCLNSAQIKELMLLFSFEATRLELAQYAHDRCVDPNNYFLLNDAFQFESSVEELNNSIK